MARQIRIDALASDCGVAPREVLRVLIELGQFRYTRFNQQINEELAQQVRARLEPAEPSATAAPSAEEDLFAQAMRAAGVQRLDGRGQRTTGKSKRTSSRKHPVETAAPDRTAPVEVDPLEVATQPVTEPRVDEPSATPPVPAIPAPSEPEPLEARCRQLEADLAALQARHGRLEAEHLDTLPLLERLRAERDELQAVSEAAANGTNLEGAGVLALLQQRGLRGVDEAGFALRALLSAHLLDSSLPLMRTLDGGRLERVLTERLCLCCGRDECGQPEGVETVTVTVQRCELCGGRDLPRIHRLLSDACLLSGITRVTWIGGRRWHHAWIEAGADRRVQLRLRSAVQAVAPDVLAGDLDWAQLVVLWDDGALHPELAAGVRQHQPRALVEVQAASAGLAMGAAVERVERLDPSELP